MHMDMVFHLYRVVLSGAVHRVRRFRTFVFVSKLSVTRQTSVHAAGSGSGRLLLLVVQFALT